jgi:hypothetical protein
MYAPRGLMKCHLYHDHYGTDPRAVYLEWFLDPPWSAKREPRRAYGLTDWKRIGEFVQAQKTQTPPIHMETELDGTVAKLVSCTISAIDQHRPTAKLSPYSK